MDILTNCSALPEIGTHKTCLNDVYFFVIYQILFMHAIVLLKEGMLKLFQFLKEKKKHQTTYNLMRDICEVYRYCDYRICEFICQ